MIAFVLIEDENEETIEEKKQKRREQIIADRKYNQDLYR